MNSTQNTPVRLSEPISRDLAVVTLEISIDALGFIVNSLERTNPNDEFTRWLVSAYHANTDDQGRRIRSEFLMTPTRTELEREFLDASVAVWRHLDIHGRCPAPEALEEGKSLRRREKVAWEAYRDAPEPYQCPVHGLVDGSEVRNGAHFGCQHAVQKAASS